MRAKIVILNAQKTSQRLFQLTFLIPVHLLVTILKNLHLKTSSKISVKISRVFWNGFFLTATKKNETKALQVDGQLLRNEKLKMFVEEFTDDFKKKIIIEKIFLTMKVF